jgi:hypothetical protein
MHQAQSFRKFLQLALSCALVLLLFASIKAQQPFVTDDADVTPKGHLHFEFSNEFDWLQPSSFPNLKQNTADFELNYGLFEGLEIGFQAPLITLFNDRGTTSRTVSGLGDSNISAKYNFYKERENSRLPAMTIALNVELPTGDTRRQLGSGLEDFYLNGILQKTLSKTAKLRLNGGILFSGNATTGVIGIKTRGTVLTAGASLVKEFTPKLQLGIELVGATTSSFELDRGQLQTLFGGNYLFKSNASFDFGITAGKYAASPRAGVQLGLSLDF